ncbi:methylamine utilization protein MauJ [Halobacteriovorax marinus]|nr:methylamine utilization protein MauJ [Halobacteriovorax marinus]
MSKPWELQYDGSKLIINVAKLSVQHNVRCFFSHPKTEHDAHESLFRFFNEVSWFQKTSISNINGCIVHGSNVYYNYNINQESYLLEFEQRVFDKKQHLGLGFFREAISNESPFYRLLCFYKILEVPFEKSKHKDKVEWIKECITTLESELACSFRDRKVHYLGGKSLDEWLYIDGRHGVAHAHLNHPVRDPNNYQDWEDIKWANTVLEELAKKTIVQKLSVQESL